MTRNVLRASQVATRLGVQRATVYAYVSRGLLHREVGDDGRTSWFDPDEVDELARRGRPRTRAERTGSVDVVLTSSITQVDAGHLRYRGHDITALVDSPFERTAELLWAGALPDPSPLWSAPPEPLGAAHAATTGLPEGTPLATRLAVAVAAVAATDVTRGDLRPATVRRKGRTLLAVLARTPLPVGRPARAHGPRRVAAELWPRLSPDPATPLRLGVLDVALVVTADHELATSTFAARVAASTRANPASCILAAIGALSGPLHGRAALGTHRMLAEALSTGDAPGAVGGVLEATEQVPGFGHPLYRGTDPRAVLLLERVSAIGSPRVARAVDQVRLLGIEATGEQPNLDFALGALALAGSMPLGATEGVFAIARTAGWLAHALEEYDERPLRYRARAIYTGTGPVGEVSDPAG